MDRTAAAKPVEVDVSGAKVLELRTLDAGDGITCDHADWADARLER
jgi:alpha-galactosidase